MSAVTEGRLPSELIHRIGEFLSPKEAAYFGSVNRALYQSKEYMVRKNLFRNLAEECAFGRELSFSKGVEVFDAEPRDWGAMIEEISRIADITSRFFPNDAERIEAERDEAHSKIIGFQVPRNEIDFFKRKTARKVHHREFFSYCRNLSMLANRRETYRSTIKEVVNHYKSHHAGTTLGEAPMFRLYTKRCEIELADWLRYGFEDKTNTLENLRYLLSPHIFEEDRTVLSYREVALALARCIQACMEEGEEELAEASYDALYACGEKLSLSKDLPNAEFEIRFRIIREYILPFASPDWIRRAVQLGLQLSHLPEVDDEKLHLGERRWDPSEKNFLEKKIARALRLNLEDDEEWERLLDYVRELVARKKTVDNLITTAKELVVVGELLAQMRDETSRQELIEVLGLTSAD